MRVGGKNFLVVVVDNMGNPLTRLLLLAPLLSNFLPYRENLTALVKKGWRFGRDSLRSNVGFISLVHNLKADAPTIVVLGFIEIK